MLEFLAGIAAVIFEDADVLEARVAFQILNALRGQQQKLFDFSVAGIPQLPVVAKILDQHLVRTHRGHAIVDAIAAARWLSFNAIQRRGMDHGTRRPRPAIDARHVGNQLRRTAGEFGQNRQKDSARGALSGTSSPVMTHERVMGSLRNSMVVRKTSAATNRQL